MRLAFRTYFIWLVFLASFLFLGCGANNSTAESQGASITSSYISPTAALAECNSISGSGVEFTGQVSTYYQSGVLVPDELMLNITAAPPNIYSSNTAYVEIVPYSESLSGAITYGSPAPMVFMDILTGNTSNEYSEISLSNIKAALQTLGLTSSITPSEFFERVYVVLLGIDQIYDAASVQYFDSSQSSTALASGNFLLPIFYANPSVYEAYKPVADLEELHPFWSYLNSGYSDSEFQAMDESICQEMAGGGRIPASIGPMDEMDMVSTAKSLAGFLHTPLGAQTVHLNFFAHAWARFWVACWLPAWHRIADSLALNPFH